MTSPVDILETENLKKKEETNEPGKDIATVIICRIKPLGSVFEPVPPSHEAESSNIRKIHQEEFIAPASKYQIFGVHESGVKTWRRSFSISSS